jgi:hypothetical protein
LRKTGHAESCCYFHCRQQIDLQCLGDHIRREATSWPRKTRMCI